MATPSNVITPTELDVRGIPKIDMAGAHPTFELRKPMEPLDERLEISRVTVDIQHTGQKTSMTVDISFRLPDGKFMPNDQRFSYRGFN